MPAGLSWDFWHPSCDLATITGAASLQALLALAGVGMLGCPLVPIAQAELSSPGQQCQGSWHPSSFGPQHVAQDIRVAPGCPHSPMNHPVSMSRGAVLPCLASPNSLTVPISEPSAPLLPLGLLCFGGLRGDSVRSSVPCAASGCHVPPPEAG